MNIKDHLTKLRASLPGGVKLVAVTKFRPETTIMEAYDAGLRLFGENRVQELTVKQPNLPGDIEWHLIGTLQTNKVKYIAPFVTMIQSVDSYRLMQEINRQAEKCNRIIRVLVEVHIADEKSKHGFSPDACRTFFSDGIPTRFKNIQICGLMGMATFTDNMEQVRREFRNLRRLFDEIRSLPAIDESLFAELSMGMSDDYQIALEEGSTMVRIGTALFGTRALSVEGDFSHSVNRNS